MSPTITIKENYVLLEPGDGIDFREIQRGVARLFYVDRIPDKNRIWLFRDGPQSLSGDDLYKLKDMIKDNYPEDTRVSKTAIVVTSESQTGVAELFAEISRELPQTFKVFYNLADAEAWVNEG